MNMLSLAIAFESSLSLAVANVIVKSTLLLALTAVVTLLLHRSSAALKHRLWSLAVCGLFALPVLEWALPGGWKLPILPAERVEEPPSAAAATVAVESHDDRNADATETPPAIVPFVQPPAPFIVDESPLPRMEFGPPVESGSIDVRMANEESEIREPVIAMEPLAEPVPPETPAVAAAPSDRVARTDFSLVAAVLWVAIALLLSARLVLGLWTQRRQRGRSKRVIDEQWLSLLNGLRERMGLWREVALLQSADLGVPVACGLLRPAICLPADADGWPDDLRRTVLMHELAHIQRHDVAWQLAAQLACCLHWFNPLAWHARRQLRLAREMACDDCVLSLGEPATAYAAQLVQIAKQYRPVRHSAVVAMAQAKSLELRVRALFDATRSHLPLGRSASRTLLIVSLALSSAIAVIRPTARGEEPAVAQTSNDTADEDAKADAVDETTSVAAKETQVSPDDSGPPQRRIAGVVLDESGAPVPGVEVEKVMWPSGSTRVETDSDGRFEFASETQFTRVIARGETGLLGYDQVQIPDAETVAEVVLTLRPARMIDVHAVFEGEPVADATVALHDPYSPLANGLTDNDGNCRLVFPQDANYISLAVFKSGVGFAGLGSRDESLKSSAEEFTLELQPAGRLTARVRDQQDRPIAGATVNPYSIDSPAGQIFLVKDETTLRVSDERGEAVFDYLPVDVEEISFSASTADEEYRISGTNWSREDGSVVTLTGWKYVTLTGTAFNVDGEPTPGVALILTGEGFSGGASALNTVTNEQGEYEFRVPSGSAYVIGLPAGDSAAQSLSGFIVPDEGTLAGLDLQFIPGTLLHGVVQTDDGTQLPGGRLYLVERSNRVAISHDGISREFAPTVNRYLPIDESGRFSVRLGPASYYAMVLGEGNAFESDMFYFDVIDQEEIEHDVLIAAPREVELFGRVYREVDGVLEPLSGVEITGTPIEPSTSNLRDGISDENGAFRVSWHPCQAMIHAMSADGAWGLTQLLDGSEESLELVLLPTTTATGQLMENGVPLAGFRFGYDIIVQVTDEGAYSPVSRSEGETDDEGRFTMVNLIQNQEYWCSFSFPRPAADPERRFSVSGAVPVDFGQVEYRGSRTRDRTYIERMRAAYRGAATDLQTVLDDARFQEQHLLLIVGDQESNAVRDLFRFCFPVSDQWSRREPDPPFQRLLQDFEFLGLEFDALREDTDLDPAIPSAADEPVSLFVLDATGRVLGVLPPERFVTGDEALNPRPFQEFLEQHRPLRIDAEQRLERALSEAAASDPPKFIVVHEVDSFLAKSRRLSRFFIDHADSLGDHFIYLPVNPRRMTRGYEFLEALGGAEYARDAQSSWVSCFIGVMNSDGELLGSTKFSGHETPFAEGEAERFADLLHRHAPEISRAQIISWLDPERDDQAAAQPVEAGVTGIVVDEAGDPVPGAVVECQTGLGNNPRVTADAAGRFAADTPRRCDQIVARGPNGDLIGHLNLGYDDTVPTRDLQVVLKPARMVDVTVTFEGQPVAEAIIQINARQLPVGMGMTDGDGNCRLAIPRDAVVQTVLAVKHGVGFAGWQTGDGYDTREVDDSPDAHSLKLSPAAHAAVRVNDREGNPLKDIVVSPGWVHMEGQTEHVTLGVCEALRRRTNDEGVVVFDVFPAAADHVTFFAWSPDVEYHMLAYGIWRPGSDGPVELEVWPLGTVTGTVFDTEGRPAPGIPLKLVGEGPETSLGFNSSIGKWTTTNDQGRYEFRIPPDHPFLIGVDDVTLATNTLRGMLPADTPVLDQLDVHLIPGTRFHGSLLLDPAGSVEDCDLSVMQTVDTAEIVVDGRTQVIERRFFYSVVVDAETGFSVMLGPGRYLAICNGRGVERPPRFEFEITDQTEIKHDFALTIPPIGELAGRVLREVDGNLEPAAGVSVTAFGRDGPLPFTDLTDEMGVFEVPWQGGRVFLYTVSENGGLGAAQFVEGATDAVEDLVLRPTTTASGQLRDKYGPLTGFSIEYEQKIDESRGYGVLSGRALTDDEGRFTIEGLLPGMYYEARHPVGPHSSYWVARFTVEDEGPVDLGIIEYDSEQRLRTPEERIRESWLGAENATAHVESALSYAKFHGQHVLVVVGEPDSQAVVKLFHLFFNDNSLIRFTENPYREQLRHFELCGLSPRDAVASGIEEIAAAGNGDRATLIVLTADGGVLETLSEEQFVDEDGSLVNTVVESLLIDHLPPPLDGEQRVAEALEEAAAADPDKLVLVHEVDNYLGRSRCLSNFVQDNSAALGEHFVYLPIDRLRTPQGYELLQRVSNERYSSDGGVGEERTWIALVSVDGERVASTAFVGLGPKLTDEDIDRFITLLMEHVPQISEQELGSWLDELNATEAYGPR